MCFIEKVTAIGRVTAIGYRPAIGCDIYESLLALLLSNRAAAAPFSAKFFQNVTCPDKVRLLSSR